MLDMIDWHLAINIAAGILLAAGVVGAVKLLIFLLIHS